MGTLLLSPASSPAPKHDHRDGSAGRLRLDYLDGVRGLAALYVVFHHAFSEVAILDPPVLPAAFLRATAWLWDGLIAVQVFIVLSGYCLMLPVARTGDGRLRGGVGEFVRRRAWRILPPYWAALALSLGVIALVPGMNVAQGVRWDIALPAWTPGVIGSHLLLLQDLRPDWLLKINHPMWSIAQEWQIYFVFALVLLPLWRRAGSLAVLGVTLALAVLLRRFAPAVTFSAGPAFLFLFSVGMAGAALSFSAHPRAAALRRARVPWGGLALGLFVLYAAAVVRWPTQEAFHAVRMTVLVGAMTFCLLAHCTRAAQAGTAGDDGDEAHPALSRTLGFFRTPALLWLGTISYSLYLTHAPVLAMATLALRHWQVPGPVALGVQFLVAVPLATLLGYGFHLACERPFMPGRPRTERQAEAAAVASPAP